MWTFFFFSMDVTASNITTYVLSYQWEGARLSPLSYFQTFKNLVILSSNATMMVGGDGMLSNCNCLRKRDSTLILPHLMSPSYVMYFHMENLVSVGVLFMLADSLYFFSSGNWIKFWSISRAKFCSRGLFLGYCVTNWLDYWTKWLEFAQCCLMP